MYVYFRQIRRKKIENHLHVYSHVTHAHIKTAVRMGYGVFGLVEFLLHTEGKGWGKLHM